MIMQRNFRFVLPSLLLLGLFFLLASCGKGGKNDIKANFSGNGYSLLVEQSSTNTYHLTVVSNDTHKGAVFTVYGLIDASQIGTFTPTTRMRLANVADGSNPGESFDVTFHSDDTWFIIYEDAFYNGQFNLDTTKEMIRGNFRQ